MKSRNFVRICTLVGACALTHCSEASRSRQAEVGASTPECRTYAAAGSVRWGGMGGDISCDFDAASHRHECRLAAGDSTLVSSAEYESVADFVEAGHFIGKVTSLSETRTKDGAVQRLIHHYDELGRLVRRVEDDSGRTIVHTYADYDASGRPRRARLGSPTASDTDCSALAVSIAYSDVEGTVSRRFRPINAEHCGFAERTRVEYYDRGGNPLSIDEADGSGVATRFEAGPGAQTRQVCL